MVDLAMLFVIGVPALPVLAIVLPYLYRRFKEGYEQGAATERATER